MQNRFLRTARVAGLLYLVVAVGGGFAEVVRTNVVESDNAAATVENILDSELLFRIGFSSDIVAFSAEIALALVFYALFRPVNQTLALLAAFFRLGQACVLGINMLNQFFVLLLLSGEDYLTALDTAQLHTLVLLFLETHSYGYLIGLVFFGLSTLVLGYLVLKSGAFPSALAILLMVIVPFGYVMDSFTSFLISDKAGIVSVILIAPAVIVELLFIVWLLIKAPEVQPDSLAGASAG